jgi:hypothetical protein
LAIAAAICASSARHCASVAPGASRPPSSGSGLRANPCWSFIASGMYTSLASGSGSPRA